MFLLTRDRNDRAHITDVCIRASQNLLRVSLGYLRFTGGSGKTAEIISRLIACRDTIYMFDVCKQKLIRR